MTARNRNIGSTILLGFALTSVLVVSAFWGNAQPQSVGTFGVNVAVEEKIALTPLETPNGGTIEYNLNKHTGSKKITVAVEPDDVTRLMLSEFCFEGIGQEPIWSAKSSATFNLPSRHAEVVVKARSEGGLFYQTTIKLTDGRSFGVIDFVVAILIVVAAICAIYFWSRLKILRTTLSLENQITDRTRELQAQKVKYDELVANYMPKEEFEKLKEKSKYK